MKGKIYVGTCSAIVETTLLSLMKDSFEKLGLETSTGGSKEYAYLEVIQENKKGTKEVTSSFYFSEDNNRITEHNIFVSKIKRVVDEKNMKKLV